MLPWEGHTLVGTTDTKGPVRRQEFLSSVLEDKDEIVTSLRTGLFRLSDCTICFLRCEHRRKHLQGHQRMKLNGYLMNVVSILLLT